MIARPSFFSWDVDAFWPTLPGVLQGGYLIKCHVNQRRSRIVMEPATHGRLGSFRPGLRPTRAHKGLLILGRGHAGPVFVLACRLPGLELDQQAWRESLQPQQVDGPDML